MNDIFNKNSILRFIDHSEYIEIKPFLSEIKILAGATVFEENSTGKDIYIIITGSVNLVKMGTKENIIARLSANEYFGEMSFIDHKPRSVSVVAACDCTLLKIDMENISSLFNYQVIYKKILRGISETLSSRIRLTNELTVEEMEKKILFGYFIFLLLALVSIYNLMQVSVFKYFTRFNGSLISFITIAFFSVFCLIFVIKSKLSWSEFGFSTHQLGHKCIEAILYSLPFMALAVAVKIAWLMWEGTPIWGHIFSPENLFISMHKPFNIDNYFMLMLAYALFCIPQEFVGRGVFQTIFTKFLNQTSPLGIIIITNLVFAAVHIHKSFTFVLAAFIPGLFWGYLFYKQRSVLSVSLSHALIGIWVIFIIGLTL